uniref:Uncharacterized protein n=1 Tax=Romanomermis culicivorax TaxID=13658 RepID=A0A915I4Q6_ROMCU
MEREKEEWNEYDDVIIAVGKHKKQQICEDNLLTNRTEAFTFSIDGSKRMLVMSALLNWLAMSTQVSGGGTRPLWLNIRRYGQQQLGGNRLRC